jgi:hypothetical protein
MKKLLGIFLSTVAMFAFGAVYWMSPLSSSFVMKAGNDDVVGRQLKESFKVSGTYFVPGEQDDAEKRAERFRTGPVAMVHIRVDGGSEMDPKMLGLGFVHELVSMFIAAAIMGSLLGVLKTYAKRVGFMLGLGGLIALYGNLGNAIWWFNSWDFTVVVAIHTVLAWGIAGLVLAAFIKPNPAKTG